VTVRPENLPENQVRIEGLADVVDLVDLARSKGVPAEVATKLPAFVLAKQLGRGHGLSEATETSLRKALRLVLVDGHGPGPAAAGRRPAKVTPPIGG
jgi:hypothetical protein